MEGKKLWRSAAGLGAGFLVGGTLMPLIRTNRWWVRAFDFPRLQIGGAALLSALLYARRRGALTRPERVLAWSLVGSAALQGIQILPYTRAVRREVMPASPEEGSCLRILIANVLQTNRRTDILRDYIRKCEPDLFLLTETDEWWAHQLECMEKDYPHRVAAPLDNTYGMLLYSRLPLIDPEVRFVVKEEIPSIRTRVRLPNRQEILFYGVHPEPPGTKTPEGDIRGSGPRDVELVLLAKELEKETHPVVVAGDFNDVAWSHTTRLFKRISRLLDPRVGRGLYNTFHASHWLLRYPLDHFFHSEHFALVQFERGPWTGSDHFPVVATLSLIPEAAEVQEQEPPDRADHEEAREILKTGPED